VRAISEGVKRVFIEALAQGHTVTRATKIAGINDRSPYLWRQKDPEFAELWDQAIEAGCAMPWRMRRDAALSKALKKLSSVLAKWSRTRTAKS